MTTQSTNYLNWEKRRLKHKTKISAKDLQNRFYTSTNEYNLFSAKYKNEINIVDTFLQETDSKLLIWFMRNFTVLQNLDCFKHFCKHVDIAWQESTIRGTVNLQTKDIMDYSILHGAKFDGYNSSFKYPISDYFDSIVRKK